MLIRVEAASLKVGMFVAELDRPWIDTPFLIQGFLIEDEEDLVRLRHYCEFVFVDPKQSAAGLLPTRPRSESGPRTRSPRSSPSMRITATDASPDSFLPEDDGPPPLPVRRDFIPADIDLVYHRETATMVEEIAPARQFFDRAQDVVLQMMRDVQTGRLLILDHVEEVIEDVVDSMLRNPDAMMWVAQLKRQDEALYGHGLQAALYLVALGRHLGLPKEHLGRLGMLGLLFDIGKTRLPRTLLAKPGQLTSEEFAMAKAHVGIGLDLLKDTPNLHPETLEGIAQHHEREDGSGYPGGLSGRALSMFGRMAAVIDSFVALTNVRSYASAVSPYEALRKVSGWSPRLFHAPLVEQFIQAIGVFPIGSLVELSTGEVAVVVRQSRVRRLKPRVLVVCGPDKSLIPNPAPLDLLYQSVGADADPVHIARGLPAGAYGVSSREYYLS